MEQTPKEDYLQPFEETDFKEAYVELMDKLSERKGPMTTTVSLDPVSGQISFSLSNNIEQTPNDLSLMLSAISALQASLQGMLVALVKEE